MQQNTLYCPKGKFIGTIQVRRLPAGSWHDITATAEGNNKVIIHPGLK
jgi:hypothetical protein